MGTTTTPAVPESKNGSAAASQSAAPAVVKLPELKLCHLEIHVVGTSPLIVHKWSAKAIRQMLDKQLGKAKTGKEPKNPEQDYEDSLYRTDDGQYAFPAIAFKAAAVRAGTYADMKMTYLRGAFHIPAELVVIDGEPHPREDIVRLQGNTADIRYRGEFTEWSAVVPVDLNEKALSVEQLINLFRLAGFSVGIGEWRPERDGSNGRFEVKGFDA